MASALASDESLEENRRIRDEQNLDHDLKEYLIALNLSATSDEAKLNILARGFECTLDDFVFVVYVCRRWRKFVIDSLSKYIEEKCHEKVLTNQNRPCTWIQSD